MCDLRSRAISASWCCYFWPPLFDTLISGGFCGCGRRRRRKSVASSSSSRPLFCLWHHCHPGQTRSHERMVYRDSPANAPLPATTTTCVMLSQPADSDSPRRLAFQATCSGTTCHSSRGQTAKPVLFLGGHGGIVPCLLAPAQVLPLWKASFQP
jgi:hypothetical protein